MTCAFALVGLNYSIRRRLPLTIFQYSTPYGYGGYATALPMCHTFWDGAREGGDNK